MKNKFIIAAAILMASHVALLGYNYGDSAAFNLLFSRGTVTQSGSRVLIPDLENDTATYSVIVKNDSTSTGNLLVKVDPGASVGASGIPTPADDIEDVGKVAILEPGDIISLDIGVQSVGVRAQTVDVTAKVFATTK